MRRKKRARGPPTIPLVRGASIHKAVENFYKFNLHRCSNVDYGELRQITIDLFTDDFIDRITSIGTGRLGLNETDLAYIAGESKDMMINFLEDFITSHGFESPKPLIEKSIYSKELPLMARLDRLNLDGAKPKVRDWKTSKSKKITPEIERQMSLCALLTMEKYGAWPDLEVHFLHFCDGVVSLDVSKNRKSEIENLVMDVYRKTESNDVKDYPCTCGWCDINYGNEIQP